jgi:hypothetical protein
VSNEEKQLLFGEYAAGRISAADKRRLMAAALEDQELFDAIAEQEELGELTVSLPVDLSDAMADQEVRGALTLSSPAAAPPVMAKQQELGESTVSRPAPLPPRKIWPYLATAAATGAATLGLFFAFRPQPEPVVEMAKSEPAPVPMAVPPPPPVVERKRAPLPMAAPKMAPPAAPVPEALAEAEQAPKKMEAAPVASFAAAPPYRVLHREPEGPPQLVDGEALVVRYRAAEAGRFALVDVASGQELAAATGEAGQTVDLPFIAARGAMNLEIRRAEVGLAARRMADRAESRAAAPAGGGGPPRQAPGPVRISLTIR